jgi:hypothetical protein
MWRALCLAAGLWASAGAAEACRLALMLALDVSSSVDAEEDRLQREGLAAALGDPDVRSAFLTGGPVAFAVYEWSGKYQQHPILNWQMAATDQDLDAIAEVILTSRRIETEFPTALGYSLGYATTRFKSAPNCQAQTLDLSGDGENNDGFPPEMAYRHFPFEGVTVNGLVIGATPDLLAYFEREVMYGPDAFVEEARDYADFERAMRQKLIRELQPRAIGQVAE